MEVTTANFDEVLLLLPEVFKKAQFITIDTEFTGLRIQGTELDNRCDTPETLYRSYKRRVESFVAIQYGIVVFYYNPDTDSYSHEGFNFYVYPSTLIDSNFICQASSLKFLVDSGFDFNKLISQGIPYLRDVDKNSLIKVIDEKCSRAINSEEQYTSYMEDNECLKTEVNGVIAEIDNIFKCNEKKVITIPKFNSFIRKGIYTSVINKYDNKVLLITNPDKTMTACVGFTPEECEEEIRNHFQREKDEVLKQVGFSQVIKLIIESRKMIIGHNFFFDLMFTINQFIEPLPSTLMEFTRLAHFLFPNILDTKSLAFSHFSELSATNLLSLYEYFKKSGDIPTIDIAKNGKGFKGNDDNIHVAVYDAYLTGLCFLAMCNSLGKRQNIENIFETISESCFLSDAINKLYIKRLIDVPPCLSLTELVPEPDRSNTFHITFPGSWKRNNILELFKPYGSVKISWINEKSAYISINKKHVSKLKKMKKLRSKYHIRSFYEYHGLPESKQSTNSDESRENAECNSATKINIQKRFLKEDTGEVLVRPKEEAS